MGDSVASVVGTGKSDVLMKCSVEVDSGNSDVVDQSV